MLLKPTNLCTLCAVFVAMTANVRAGCQGYAIDWKGCTRYFLEPCSDNSYCLSNRFRVETDQETAVFDVEEIKSVSKGASGFLVVMRDGREITATKVGTQYEKPYSRWHYDRLSFKQWNALKKQVTGGGVINWVKIVFTNDVGPFRQCPADGSTWPSDFVFCPHCGEATIWASPSGEQSETQTGPAFACPKCNYITHSRVRRCPRCATKLKPAKTDIMRKTFDYLLGRAGIDPTSREAEMAKGIAKKVLNPFTTEEEMLRTIKQAASETTGDKIP